MSGSARLLKESIEYVGEGIASAIFRGKRIVNDNTEEYEWVILKRAPTTQSGTPEPHDIYKEIKLLSSLHHPNPVFVQFAQIISFLGWRYTSSSREDIEMVLPFLPYSLHDLLNSPAFSPHDPPAIIQHLVVPLLDEPSKADTFEILARSIAFQIISALNYLHNEFSPEEPIAHRDVKPRNILLTATGRIQLIDFGVAYSQKICSLRSGILWPENSDRMYADVSSGPYRAPELIFGPTSYDACAIDLWSTGALIAEFFTPLRLARKSNSFYDEDDEDADEDDTHNDSDDRDSPPIPRTENGYILPKDVDSMTFYSAEWHRRNLFDAKRGSIGLAWSIFSLRGTPNEQNWPDFESLPDATKVTFKQVPAVGLKQYLPNLITNKYGDEVLDLIDTFLSYSPSTRLKAKDALQHPWFSGHAADLILPTDYPDQEGRRCTTVWRGKDLGHWLALLYAGRR